MRIQIYISIKGDESTIRAIDGEANPSNVCVSSQSPGAAVEHGVWHWSTQPIDAEAGRADRGLDDLGEAFLTYRRIFSIISRHRTQGTEVFLEMVREHDPEGPCGLYLSAETIATLSEIGAGFNETVIGS